MPTITDWLMVGITLVYVIATIAIWFANHKSARATEKQLIESKRQFDEIKRLEHMPYMQVSFGEWNQWRARIISSQYVVEYQPYR